MTAPGVGTIISIGMATIIQTSPPAPVTRPGNTSGTDLARAARTSGDARGGWPADALLFLSGSPPGQWSVALLFSSTPVVVLREASRSAGEGTNQVRAISPRSCAREDCRYGPYPWDRAGNECPRSGWVLVSVRALRDTPIAESLL